MADAPVEFDQKKFFDQSDPLLNAVLQNVASFAGDLSGGLGTLVEFLNLTKIYLQAIADPIALILIPAIDQLIDAIEDLKNIGFGTLSVWPWESGQVESGIDSTKALEAIQALIVALNDINPDKLKWNPSKNQFESINVLGDSDQLQQQGAGFLDSQPFGFSSHEQVSIRTEDGQKIEAKSLSDTWINNTLNTCYNYLNPKEWEEGDNSAKRAIDSLNESFKIRTLTPAQFVSEVNSSFDDFNDPARPVGTGEYVAFVAFFALPTHHALRDMINALLKFFANFLKGIPDLADDKVSDIELGHPLVIANLETDLRIATGEAIIEADSDIAKAADELATAQDAEFSAGVDVIYGTGTESTRLKNKMQSFNEKANEFAGQINDYNFEISALTNRLVSSPEPAKLSIQAEIARLSDLKSKASQEYRQNILVSQEFGRRYANEMTRENNLNESYNKSIETVKQAESRKNEFEKIRESISFDTTELQKKFYTLDSTSPRDLSSIVEQKTFTPDNNTHNGVTIPMFEEGTLIQQGHVFNDFTAEVVRHVGIVVKDGQVISNKVRVRKVRGSIKENTASPNQQINVPPIIALDGKQLDSFGILKTGEGIQGATDALNYPLFAPTNPDVPQLQSSLKFKASITTGSNILKTVLPLNDELISYGGKDVYTNTTLINQSNFQLMMENFVEGLVIGSPLSHNFLLNSNTAVSDVPVDPLNRLGWSLFPGMGFTPCIKDIKINGKPIQRQDIKTQLFQVIKTDSKDIEYDRMHEITIELGTLVKDGDIESFDTQYVKVPNGTVINADLEVPITMNKITGGRSSIPNWKFTRVQDIFPIYGQVLDRIIDKLEFAKDLASGALEDINKWIKYFEDLVRDLKKLNEDIQSLLQFLTNGLDKAGLYSARFSGTGGPAGFKRKLNSAKIKNVNLEPVKEFSLEPVTITRQRQNPITGEQESFTQEILKLVQKENPDRQSTPENPYELISWSDLDVMKYSGGFVFYAQGNDKTLLEKFLATSGLTKPSEKENPPPQVEGSNIDFSEINSLIENIQPRVSKVQVKQTGFLNDEIFVDADGRETVRKNTEIKIIFTNDSSLLSTEERNKIKEAKGNDFIFDVDIQYGSIQPATTDDATAGNVILSKDDFVTAEPLAFSVQPIRTETEDETFIVSEVIIKPKNKLEALTNYKLKIKRTISNSANQLLKEEFEMEFGFTTSATTIIDIGIQ